MTNLEIIEQLENTIGLIKQDGKDWLDDRDIPMLEACIKALTALDKIRAEIQHLSRADSKYNKVWMSDVLTVIDKYREGVKNDD